MLPTLEDSVVYVRGNFQTLYPPEQGRRKTIGNLPAGLHQELQEYADARNLKLFEILAGLWDFVAEYERVNETELTTQRAANKLRRNHA